MHNIKKFSDSESLIKKILSNDKWILYIGSKSCGDCVDLSKNIMPTIFKRYNNKNIYYLDYDQKDIYDNLDMIIGSKNGTKSGQIKNFEFKYMPSIVFINNGVAKFVFDNFGGGKLYQSRYYRWTKDRSLGYQNAIEDLSKMFEKFNH